jgi:hypothetical protein
MNYLDRMSLSQSLLKGDSKGILFFPVEKQQHASTAHVGVKRYFHNIANESNVQGTKYFKYKMSRQRIVHARNTNRCHGWYTKLGEMVLHFLHPIVQLHWRQCREGLVFKLVFKQPQRFAK